MKKIVFCNAGWMKDYRGIGEGSEDTQITGGGKFVKKLGYGHEIFNFLPCRGFIYGYVRTVKNGQIRIERLGAAPEDDSISGVLVVWVATSPLGGRRIVGWYDNATVYRYHQDAPETANRIHNGEMFGFHIKAREEDCTLLPIDRRLLKVPGSKEITGGMGQSNVWYADQKELKPFIQKVLDFINNGGITGKARGTHGKPCQPDPLKRQKVEEAAVRMVVDYYESMNYSVDSVEKDNAGWDLEAIANNDLSIKLLLEVKGLSQREMCIELTPNEYRQMQQHTDSYRICVVADALGSKPLLHVFSFSPESGAWEDSDGNRLRITEIISARMNMMS